MGGGASLGALQYARSAPDDQYERTMVETGQPYPILISGGDPRWRETPIIGQVNDGNAAKAFDGIATHAGLFSTVDDLLVWGRARLAEFGDKRTAEFFQPASAPEQGLGWRIMTRTDPAGEYLLYWHPGFTGTAVGIAPERGLAVVMLTNRLAVGGEPVPTAELFDRLVSTLERGER
jgi:CubicO group peptidase (beta-lactamase class C family)